MRRSSLLLAAAAAAALLAIARAGLNEAVPYEQLCSGKYELGAGLYPHEFAFNCFHLNRFLVEKNDQLMSGPLANNPPFLSGSWNPNTGVLDVLLLATPWNNPSYNFVIVGGTLARLVSHDLKPVPNDPYNLVSGHIKATFYNNGPGTEVVFDDIYFPPTRYTMGMQLVSEPNSFQAGQLTLWGSQGWNETAQDFDEIGNNRMGADIRFTLGPCVPDIPLCPSMPCSPATDCSQFLPFFQRVSQEPVGAPARSCYLGSCSILENAGCTEVRNANQAFFDQNPMLWAEQGSGFGAWNFATGNAGNILTVGGFRASGSTLGAGWVVDADGVMLLPTSPTDAVFQGRIHHSSNPNLVLQITLNLSGRTTVSAFNYNAFGAPSTADWVYYTSGSGTLSGVAGKPTAGFVANIALPAGKVFQYGTGAMNKNGLTTAFGAYTELVQIAAGDIVSPANSPTAFSYQANANNAVPKIAARLASQCRIYENCEPPIIENCCPDNEQVASYVVGASHTFTAGQYNCVRASFV